MNNRRLFFILVKFNYQKYRSRKYHALIDTGANLTVAKYNVLPPELWKRKQKMLRMESAGKEIHMIELESRNVNIQIGEYELVIQELNQYNEPSCDVILGLDFLSQYYPLHLIEKAIILTTPCKHEAWGIRITNPYRRKDEKFQKKYNENEVQFLENNKPIEINYMLSTLIIKEVEPEEIIRLNIIEGKIKKTIEQRLIENYMSTIS